MHTGKSLYEPKLVELWNERYRNFAIDEMVRRLRETKENMKARAEAHALNAPRAA